MGERGGEEEGIGLRYGGCMKRGRKRNTRVGNVHEERKGEEGREGGCAGKE